MTDYSGWTDEQVNEVIAVKRGWKSENFQMPSNDYRKGWYQPYPFPYQENIIFNPPPFTHDWRLAGELLEEMKGITTFFYDENHRWCCVMDGTYYYTYTPQRAICEAWLVWKEQG